MKRSYFQLITIIGIISGVLLLAGGIFAATYHTEFNPPASLRLIVRAGVVYPYTAYSDSLLGAGVISTFVGIASILLAHPGKTSVKPPPPSRLRKGFLVIGIVLLILGFSFFYWASRVNWHYVTTYNDKMNLAYPSYAQNYPQFGYSYEYYAKPYGGVIMQPNDVLIVSYQSYPFSPQANGTFQIVLWEKGLTNDSMLDHVQSDWIGYQNEQPNEILVDVVFVAQNIQNVTLSSTTILNHYETPQWVYFGIGVVLSSLAVIPILESKKLA